MVDTDKYIEYIYDFLARVFESPCNFGIDGIDVAEYMSDHGDDWCEENCGNVSDASCWKRFIELKMKEDGVI